MVISYNQVSIIGTCLRALSFADEVLVIDKSSTDGTAEVAAKFSDRVITVPWTPVVEDTRAFAIAECQYEWILCLDDDECLSVEAVKFIEHELLSPRADIYGLPLRNYLIGRHDENSYYWPDFKQRLFRKGAVSMATTVHGGINPNTESIYYVPPDDGVCIHHLTNSSVSQWIEKCNRYTSQPNRVTTDADAYDLAAYAHSRIDEFVSKSTTSDRGDYATAVAVLRATYDIIDRLKVWEERSGLRGAQEFDRACRELNELYAKHLPRRNRTSVAASTSTLRKFFGYAKNSLRLNRLN